MIRFADDAAATAGSGCMPAPGSRPRRTFGRTPGGTPASRHANTPADLERLGDEIAELAAHIHAATYRLLVLLREFDARDGWHGGFRTCAHWLSWRTGVGLGAAREKVRVARALGKLPGISAAMEHGRLSFSKVRALTRVATPENEPELLEFAAHGTTAHVERLVRAWRSVDRAEEAALERARHEARSLTLYADDDGTWVVRGRLAPDVGAVLQKALEAAAEELNLGESEAAAPAERASHRQRMADAAGLVAEKALGFDGEVRRADRFQVVLHVEEGDGHSILADTGHRVPAETSRRLTCDASVVRMTHDAGGDVLHVGRRTRKLPPAIRRALEWRDRSCRFPGCEVRHTDAHHVTHWADGGETALHNLVLLCRRHHRAVHEGEVRMEGGRFFRADGRPLQEVPVPPRLMQTPRGPGARGAPGTAAASPVRSMIRAHRRAGICLDAHTTTPLWNGDPWDLGMAVDGLRGARSRG